MVWLPQSYFAGRVKFLEQMLEGAQVEEVITQRLEVSVVQRKRLL